MIRRTRFLFRLGVLVLAITIGAVVVQANRMLDRHGEGRSVEGAHDVALVLGAGIEPDGSIPYSGRRRVRAGVELYREGKVRFILLTDGSGARASKKGAQDMADFAQSLGVPREALVLELASRSTFQNLLHSQPIIDERGLQSVILITDDVHLSRSAMLADFLDFPVSGMVAADSRRGLGPFTTWPYYLREALAWWYNLYKAAIWSALGYAGWSAEDRAEFVD